MRAIRSCIVRSIPLVLGLALPVASLRAETLNCTPITSVPTTISASGIYCLTADINTAIRAGNAIEIAPNHVILGLNGHKLGGLSAGPGTSARGVDAFERQNITVRNGTIRGFIIASF